eukprot:jgi/Chlat1/241/Chrsp1S03142
MAAAAVAVARTAGGEVVDLCGYELSDGELEAAGPLPEDAAEADLTQNRLKAVPAGTLSGPRQLRRLSLRKNLIADASPLATIPGLKGLHRLLPPLEPFEELAHLDVSFNKIKSLESMAQASSTLEELFAASNKIGQIESLTHLHALRVLELGCNRIREMEGLEGLGALQQLWLGRNKIARILVPPSPAASLRQISLQSNRLTSMSGIEACTALEELYLSHNAIDRIPDLSALTQLRILDVGNNRITAIEGLQKISGLEDLWINDNQLGSLEGVQGAVRNSANTLFTIYVDNNPAVQGMDVAQLREKLLAAFPALMQIDAYYVPKAAPPRLR